MQERIVYTAQTDSYENCSEVLEKFTNVKVGATQIWRVANVYGDEVSKTLNEEINLTPCKKDEVVYAMADGSMVFTREESWKEVKVGRIFKSSDCIHTKEEKAGWITNSQYVAHLGDHTRFTHQMENLLDYYTDRRQPLVFISDGATWIKNWIQDAYPQAVSILDFYHASEYLHDFCKATFKDEKKKAEWIDSCTDLLLEGKVEQVIERVQKLKKKRKEAERLIDYYSANKDRMDYPAYKKIGVGLIGSGAIESAHRVIVQKRLKQSGQRWGKKGAQNMLNLRVVNKNSRWSKIIELTKTNFVTKAA